MSLPGNGIFVVQGEMAMLVTAMRRSTRWGLHTFPNEEYDVLMRTFQDLKTILYQVADLRELDPATYLSPFLEVIRSKETTGPVTSLALSAIHKFLSYGLIDPTHPSVPATVEDIADAVTHARFVGTDHSSDGIVLLKILQVLRTLMLSPEGAMLTDESVCEIMLSCFRTCFETRLTELLRRNAEQCLRDMTQLIFMRLPQFPPEDTNPAFNAVGLSLKRRDKNAKKKLVAAHSTNSLERVASPTELNTPTSEDPGKRHSITHHQDKNLINEAEITIEPVDEMPKKHARHSSMDLANESSMAQLLEKCVSADTEGEKEKEIEESEKVAEVEKIENEPVVEEVQPEPQAEADTSGEKLEEYVNVRGIRFTPQQQAPELRPYGLACVRELFRFLISLCNPLDAQNTSAMVHQGLTLVGTALEVGADQIAKCPSLLYLVKDALCRNLLSLLDTERISIFALDLQIWFLLFEALRPHLKYQMEAFFKKIIEITSADNTKATYELKEIHHVSLEGLSQIFRIPGLCTELYLNFDCDVYCINVFEEITKLLSKNVVSSTTYNIHTLSLEVLMTIIEAIEMGTQKVPEEITEVVPESGRGGHVTLELGGLDDSVVNDHVTHDISQYVRAERLTPTAELPKVADLEVIRNMKKWVTQGTEIFNQKPERGIEFLQEHGVLATPTDPQQVAAFLRENPDLDKKMIGEYICKRSSRGEADDGETPGANVLGAFADSFDYAGLRIDQALRLYLEAFRLPGEAPLIFLVMEKFAERWHTTNGSPFANTDAAFRLAYAVIMLNMDQHNHNAKKLNVPMTAEDFVRNLRGCNGSGDFDQAMLEAIFHSIKNEEMVMPAERVGPVRDAYLWRVLQRRGRTPAARYVAAPPTAAAAPHHAALLPAACPPAVTALSAMFERSPQPTAEEIASNNIRDCPALAALDGLERCAALIARLPAADITVDTLLLTLCKFTGLLAPQHPNYIAVGVALGQSGKARCALRRACAVAARLADSVRAAWRHLLEILTTLYLGRLLPVCLVEAEDYLAPGGKVSLMREASRGTDSGLLSSIYSYIALGESGMRAPTPHEKALIDIATECVAKCNFPGLLITETKFLQLESLQELIRATIAAGTPPDSDSLQLNPQLEDITIFFLELLGQTLIQNRDRVLSVWSEAGPHYERVVLWAGLAAPHASARALTALLRTAARLMRCEPCAAPVLRHLRLLYRLPYKLFHQHADLISCGLYELVKTSAQNIHSAGEWATLLGLLAAAGAGAWPRPANGDVTSAASSRSEGSEDEFDRRPTSVSSESELSNSPQAQGWIFVKNDSDAALETVEQAIDAVWLRPHRGSALAHCTEALALVIRDVAHVTPHNCAAVVRCLRLLAKASLASGKSKSRDGRKSRPSSARRRGYDESSDEELDSSHMVSIQLLDLMHTLHSRTAQIFKWWRDEADQNQGAEDYDLWEVAWEPLLKGIAEFCTDKRKQVANSGIAYLQRALLAPGLSALGGAGWRACVERVLLPLLAAPPARADAAARAHTLTCKVFLQHVGALSSCDGEGGGANQFASLWARVARAQAGPLAAPHEPLREAAAESLKNMLLVMHSVKIFTTGDEYNDLWYLTWDIIGEFLPNLKQELFPDVNDNRPQQTIPSHLQPSIPIVPTIVPPTNPIPPQNPPQRSTAQSPNILVGTVAQSPMVPTTPQIPTSQPVPVAQQMPVPQQIPVSQQIPVPQQIPVAQQIPMPQQVPNQLTISQQIPIPPQIPSNQPPRPPLNNIPNPTQISTPPQIPSPPQVLYPTLPAGIVAPIPINPTNPTSGSLPTAETVPTAPVSGMVPIRNPLYDQSGLTSSVLLQPLNEMISTQISIQTQQPQIYRAEETQKTEDRSEIYDEYISNPYNIKDIQDLDPKPLLPQKSYSANVTPMHSSNKAQFGSTDNVRQDSSIFNYANYFGANIQDQGSEAFEALMSTQEG